MCHVCLRETGTVNVWLDQWKKAHADLPNACSVPLALAQTSSDKVPHKALRLGTHISTTITSNRRLSLMGQVGKSPTGISTFALPCLDLEDLT